MHSPALSNMIGDRVPEFGITEMLVQESAVGPSPLAGLQVGVQAPAHGEPAGGDGLDTEQVAVGQRPAGLARFYVVVVASADDQITGAGLGAVGDTDGGPGRDDAESDELVADPAGQFPAQRVVGGHQQRVGAVRGEGDVADRRGVHHLLRVSPDDPAVLVILGQYRSVTVAQPQAGRLFPAVVEPAGSASRT